MASWADILGILSFVTLFFVFVDYTVFGAAGVWINGLWYALFSGVNDLLTGVIFSMIGRMSGPDQEIRNAISIATSRSAKVTGVLSGLFTLPLLNFFQGLCPGWNYMIVAGIFGFSIMAGMYLFRRVYDKYVRLTLKEDETAKESPIGMITICKALARNDALRTIIIADVFYYCGAYIFAGLGVYYFRLMGAFDNTYSLINGMVSAAGVAGALIMPVFGLKLGKKKSKTVWFFTYSVLTMCLGLIGGRSVWLYALVMGLGQILFNLWFFYQGPYLLDASEYYLYKTGIQPDAGIYAEVFIPFYNWRFFVVHRGADLGKVL